jgi:hypothetical protein
MKDRRWGFTLTEVLLVSCMFAIISLAVFNAFSNGFKLWARGQHVMVEGDMAIFLDKIGEDLRGTVSISGIPFKGNSMEVSFPAIILAPTDPHGSRSQEGYGDQIGAVQYTFDPFEKKIYRSQATYGQALKAQWSAPVEVASLIEDISMRYYFKADRGLDAKTQTDEGIPLGVLIDVQLMIDGQVRHMRRFLLVPIGGGL